MRQSGRRRTLTVSASVAVENAMAQVIGDEFNNVLVRTVDANTVDGFGDEVLKGVPGGDALDSGTGLPTKVGRVSSSMPDREDLQKFVLNHNLFGTNGNLSKNVARFYNPKGRDLFRRNAPMLDWVQSRGDAGLFQFALNWDELPDDLVRCRNPFRRAIEGLNFTTVDYLSLSTRPEIVEAAVRAAREVGVHSVSVGGLMGNFELSNALERCLCDWLGYESCILFPTGWAASFGALVGLARKHDVIVMDELAHASLQQGAAAATDNVFRYRHLDNADASAKLEDARMRFPDAAIVVVTEGMYSMDGDVPDLRELMGLCRKHEAFLLVDICHDLAASGPEGTGSLGEQGLLGEVDIVVGAFSKALCANGGFMLFKDPSAIYPIKFFSGTFTYSTSISPIQAAVALKAIEIARSDEGESLRRALRLNSARLREGLEAAGLRVFGKDGSHIVPLHLGPEGFGRIAGGRAFELGLVATVIEFPVVPLGSARYRFSMRPSYSIEQIDHAIALASRAVADATVLSAPWRSRGAAR
jgi:glycine C-acetyltransferase